MTEVPVTVALVAGDIEAARPLLSRAEQSDGSAPISDQALLAVSQGQRELFLVHDASGSVVAAGVIGQGELDLVVDPAERGRGIGSAALPLLLERSTGPTLAWAHGENPAANALLERSGFRPVRSLYRMALDPSLLPAPGIPVAVPDGFTLRAFDPALPGDAAAWVRVNAAAFATHPEQGRITEADFALIREEPWYLDDDLLLLEAPRAEEIAQRAQGDASASDAPSGVPHLAGSTWIKTLSSPEQAGETETELYAVGVDPEYAGQGLGRVLLDATLARMADHDPARITLYVDGENERAVRMYETAGFTIDSRSRQWRAEVPDDKNDRIDS